MKSIPILMVLLFVLSIDVYASENVTIYNYGELNVNINIDTENTKYTDIKNIESNKNKKEDGSIDVLFEYIGSLSVSNIYILGLLIYGIGVMLGSLIHDYVKGIYISDYDIAYNRSAFEFLIVRIVTSCVLILVVIYLVVIGYSDPNTKWF